MKKSIIASLLFIILVIPPFTHAWYSEAHYDAVECAICGKTIYVYQEASYGPYMPSVTSSGRDYYYGEEAKTFSMSTRYLCSDCRNKYSKDFLEHIESFYVNRRLENRELIENHQEERRLKDVEDRKKKIIELEKELEGLRK